jgi:hypothetical protein
MPQPFLVDPALPIHQLKTQPFASSSFASCAVAVSFSAHEIERRPVLRKAQVINKTDSYLVESHMDSRSHQKGDEDLGKRLRIFPPPVYTSHSRGRLDRKPKAS